MNTLHQVAKSIALKNGLTAQDGDELAGLLYEVVGRYIGSK